MPGGRARVSCAQSRDPPTRPLVFLLGRRRQPPFWVWNAAFRQLYLSSYHLAPENISAYLGAIEKYRVSYIFGYASALATIAEIALARRWRVPALRVAISNAEPFYEHQ